MLANHNLVARSDFSAAVPTADPGCASPRVSAAQRHTSDRLSVSSALQGRDAREKPPLAP